MLNIGSPILYESLTLSERRRTPIQGQALCDVAGVCGDVGERAGEASPTRCECNWRGVSESKQIPASIWGPPMWFSMHVIARSYPDEPTSDASRAYGDFFRSLAGVLPCVRCASDYAERIAPGGTTPLDAQALSSKSALSGWVYRLHNDVSAKLGKPLADEATVGVQFDSLAVVEAPRAGVSITGGDGWYYNYGVGDDDGTGTPSGTPGQHSQQPRQRHNKHMTPQNGSRRLLVLLALLLLVVLILAKVFVERPRELKAQAQAQAPRM